MMWWRAWLVLIVLGCGGGSSPHLGNDGGGGGDGLDSSIDAHDALIPGMLSAEPADPASTTPCTGLLGFPGPPLTTFTDLSGASELELGDVSGDGVLDAVLSTGSTLQLFVGNGDGTVDTPTLIASLSNNVSPRLRDMNGDTKLDLVFGHLQTPTLYVMVNDGSGGLLASQELTSSLAVTDALEAEDLNNDGKRDLIAYSYQSRSVSVTLATATGYAPAITYQVANVSIYGFALGDLTGDGRPDVVTAGSSGIYVTPNNGSGVFGAPTSYGTIGSALRVWIKDVNGDGARDVLTTGLVGNVPSLAVHLNQGNGALGAYTAYPSGITNLARQLAFGDVDGDGKIDVIASAFSGGKTDIALSRGDGAGAFGTPQVLAPDGAEALALGDVDGDGDRDFITASESGFKTYRNTGVAPYFDQRTVIDSNVNMWSLRMVDLDADGKLDLIGGGTATGGFNVVTRRAEGTGFASATTGYTATVVPRQMIRSDLDNDNDLDLVAGGSTGIVGLLNNSSGGLVAQPPAVTTYASRLLDGDFTGDGRRDIVLITDAMSIRTLTLCPGNGDGTFATCAAIWSEPTMHAPARGDLNMDGHLDLVVSIVDSTGKVAVLFGTGAGSFGTPTLVPFVNYPPGGMFIRDFTGDGNPDVLDWGQMAGPVVSPGNGAGGVTASTQIGQMPFANDAVLADMNGDGTLDVVTTGWHRVGIALGQPNGTFQATVYYEAYGLARTVSVTDIDADGRLDVLVDHGSYVSMLRGRCL